MLVIVLTVFAVLVHNGESSCMTELQSAMESCQNKLQGVSQEVSGMSDGDAKNKKLCCAINSFGDCITSAGKNCGDAAEQAMKQALQMAKAMVRAPCDDYTCSGASSIVPVNAIALYLLLFLGYLLCKN
uniref:U33-Theraphotoxin-Ct1b_1 n=1 Tax=Coremiocnemis tropix TaxID=1904443 RepID=A0A482Z7W7_CORTR